MFNHQSGRYHFFQMVGKRLVLKFIRFQVAKAQAVGKRQVVYDGFLNMVIEHSGRSIAQSAMVKHGLLYLCTKYVIIYLMTVHRQTIEAIVDKITASPAPIVVLGVGIPASGKSTVLDAVGGELGIRPVDVDGVLRRTQSEGWSNGSYDKFQERVRMEAANNMRLGGVALIDAPNCDVEYRRTDIEFYRSIGARTIGAVLMDIDPELAIQRDGRREVPARQGANTIAFMHASLQNNLPEPTDGFDWVQRVLVRS